MRYFLPAFGMNEEERRIYQQQAADALRVRGTDKVPDPPRELIAQAGSRKVVVNFKPPQINFDVAGYRVYKDTEDNRVKELDASCRQVEVTATPGATAGTTSYVNIFISSVNRLGKESRKVQVQGKPTPEAYLTATGAPPAGTTTTTTPPDPPPPPEWVDAEPQQDIQGGAFRFES